MKTSSPGENPNRLTPGEPTPDLERNQDRGQPASSSSKTDARSVSQNGTPAGNVGNRGLQVGIA